jgi:hypothetical protein
LADRRPLTVRFIDAALLPQLLLLARRLGPPPFPSPPGELNGPEGKEEQGEEDATSCFDRFAEKDEEPVVSIIGGREVVVVVVEAPIEVSSPPL